MAISLKCRMCGGDLDVADGESVAECEYCGSRQTVPKVDDEKLAKLYERAGRLLRACEFDKAAGVFEQVVAADDSQAEAYWGLVLCRYGIEYVDDPAGGKKPTLHRASFESVMDDADLELACEHADAAARREYRGQAKEVERLRRRIAEVSGAEEPYDVFICYKETDPVTGDRTLDSVLAQDVYKALEAEGYRAFFSRVTLEGKLGLDYEPYIFAALNSAKVMLAVGTDYDNFDAVWVKNEWSRFLRLMERDPSKHLIPCYKGIDAYDMPSEFARLQGQDLGKVGAVQDLLHGVEKLIGKKETARPQVVQQVVAAGPQNDALLQRARMALEDEDWDAVGGFCEQVLNSDAQCATAYLYKLMANLMCNDETALKKRTVPFDTNPDYKKALRFGDDALRSLLESANAAAQKKKEAAEERARKAAEKKAKAEAEKKAKAEAKKKAEVEAKRKAIEEKRRSDAYDKAEKLRKNAVTKSDFDKAKKKFDDLGDYKDASTKSKACADEWVQIEEQAKAIVGGYEPPKVPFDARKVDTFLADESGNEIGYLETVGKRSVQHFYDEESASIVAAVSEESARLSNAELSDLSSERAKYSVENPDAASAQDNLDRAESEIDTLQSELEGLGLFRGSRKKEIAARLEQLEKDKIKAVDEIAAAKLDERIAKINITVQAANARAHSARQRVAQEELERQKKRRGIETALANPKALLQAAHLKAGILDSMESDSSVWPLVRRTPYLYELIDEGKKKVMMKAELSAGKLKMGKWRGAALSWRIIKEEPGRVLAVCSKVIEGRPYHGSFDDVTWEKCDLRKWLNGEFLNSAFSAFERAQIFETSVKNPDNVRCGTYGGVATRDKVFCLSIDEANTLFKDDADRKCGPSAHVKKEFWVFMRGDESGAKWWLRSPGYKRSYAAYVRDAGDVFELGFDVNLDGVGVRPAFWLNLES